MHWACRIFRQRFHFLLSWQRKPYMDRPFDFGRTRSSRDDGPPPCPFGRASRLLCEPQCRTRSPVAKQNSLPARKRGAQNFRLPSFGFGLLLVQLLVVLGYSTSDTAEEPKVGLNIRSVSDCGLQVVGFVTGRVRHSCTWSKPSLRFSRLQTRSVMPHACLTCGIL